MFGFANNHAHTGITSIRSVHNMVEGPQQIAVLGDESGEILEPGDRTSISPDEAKVLFVEIECESCGEVGTYPGNLVPEGDQRFHSDHDEACTTCGNPIQATVNLKADPHGGGLDVVDFQPPRGGSYNHDPYFANKIEGLGGGSPTGAAG